MLISLREAAEVSETVVVGSFRHSTHGILLPSSARRRNITAGFLLCCKSYGRLHQASYAEEYDSKSADLSGGSPLTSSSERKLFTTLVMPSQPGVHMLYWPPSQSAENRSADFLNLPCLDELDTLRLKLTTWTLAFRGRSFQLQHDHGRLLGFSGACTSGELSG